MTLDDRYLARLQLMTKVFAQNRPRLGSWFAGAGRHWFGSTGVFPNLL